MTVFPAVVFVVISLYFPAAWSQVEIDPSPWQSAKLSGQLLHQKRDRGTHLRVFRWWNGSFWSGTSSKGNQFMNIPKGRSTMLNINSRGRLAARFKMSAALALLAIAVAITSCSPLFAQTTISTGSIQGTVTDQSGAYVSGAKVTIRQEATGRVINTTTTSSGTYASGALLPGDYIVRVEAQGFKTTEVKLVVEVGVTATGDLHLEIGSVSQVVEVQGGSVEVNTEQASVQGVINTQQIENLPINGRNFLDLAQLEPGVQIQDGGNFDPTKNGFSSISFGGRFGRTARIEVDGLDVSDETVGTTTQDIPAGAIQEFQIGESMLDLSTELTSSGSVNVSTRSGTNSYHGSRLLRFPRS